MIGLADAVRMSLIQLNKHNCKFSGPTACWMSAMVCRRWMPLVNGRNLRSYSSFYSPNCWISAQPSCPLDTDDKIKNITSTRLWRWLVCERVSSTKDRWSKNDIDSSQIVNLSLRSWYCGIVQFFNKVRSRPDPSVQLLYPGWTDYLIPEYRLGRIAPWPVHWENRDRLAPKKELPTFILSSP